MQAIGQVRRYHRALWGLFLALLIAGLLSIHLATAVSADVSVNIMNFKFDPTPLVIPVGTTVVWTNQDSAPHTATSDPGSAFVFDTGMLQKGQSGKITFTMVGTFTYFCTVHPNMHGTVTVTAAGAAPTAPSASAPATTVPATTVAPPAGNPPAVTGPVGSGTGNSTGSTGSSGSSSTTSTSGSAGGSSGSTGTSGSSPTTSTSGPAGGLPAYFVRRLGDG
ncbi:MAG: cupredoxin domain-containing protein [Thermomicrobiales bacterium]